MRDGVRILISDREDETTVHLPEDYFGQVELSFRAGVLVNTRKSETLDKGKLKAATEATQGTKATGATQGTKATGGGV